VLRAAHLYFAAKQFLGMCEDCFVRYRSLAMTKEIAYDHK
jgi:hypothetical protein